MYQDSYNSNPLGFDQPQPLQSPVIHQPPQELSIQEMEDLKQQYLDELKCLSNLEYHDEVKIAELTENFNGMSIEIRKKEKLLQQEQWAYLSTHLSKRLTSFCYDDDDDDDDDDADYTSAITLDELVLFTEEPDNSLNQIEDFSEPNEAFSSIDDDSFSIYNIDYVETSPPDSELVSSEVMEIVIPEVGGIDDDILLTIKDDILREKLLNVNLLEETNTFDNSLPEFETFCFDVEEISSGSTTTHSDSSLYASFMFDLSINPFPPAERSDFYEFTDELIPFISPPELNQTRGISPRMWWRIFLQPNNYKFLMLCPPIPPFN
nr:hypothetical protein [Tanacetum cinerariifolium]